MNRRKASKGLITVGVLMEFLATLLVVSDLRIVGLAMGGVAAVLVVIGYVLFE